MIESNLKVKPIMTRMFAKFPSLMASTSRLVKFAPCAALLMGAGLAHAQSMTDAVYIALEQYPSILASQAKSSAAEADITRAQGAHYPQVSWSGTQSSYGNNNSGANSWIQSPTVNMNVWAGGKIQADVDRSRALSSASQQQQRITKDEVALLVIEAYLNWSRGLDLVKLAKENVAMHQKIMNDIKKISDIDRGRGADLSQARVRYENATLSLQQREAELGIASQRLNRMLLGKMPPRPSGMTEMPGTIPAKPEQALDEINDRHPVIAQKLAEMEAARANVDNAKSQYSPTVNVSYGKQTTQGSGQGDYIAQLTVNMPIFSGGSTVGAVDQASGQLRALEFEVKEARLTQREKLLAAWSDWKTAKERSKIGKGQSATGQAVVDSYLKQFMIGKRSLLDVLNVQADQFSYQSNAVIASYDEKAYRARVLAAMGKLAISYQARQTQKKPG